MRPAGRSGAGLTIKVCVRWLSVAVLTENRRAPGPTFCGPGGALAVSLIPPETARPGPNLVTQAPSGVVNLAKARHGGFPVCAQHADRRLDIRLAAGLMAGASNASWGALHGTAGTTGTRVVHSHANRQAARFGPGLASISTEHN